MSGSNRLTELKKPVDKQQRLAYKIDPATRYINLPIDLTPLPLAPCQLTPIHVYVAIRTIHAE